MNLDKSQSNTYSPSYSRRVLAWFEFRKRGMGSIAFLLHRITGIGLVAYLGLHLVVLSLLAVGEGAWDTFVNLARSPIVLAFDVVLVAGLLIHGLNGLRVGLVGAGIAVNKQKVMFLGLMLIALTVLVAASVRLFIH
jgi:succinate dehydrogenase / fumarate reductase, cytochrome b subunit